MNRIIKFRTIAPGDSKIVEYMEYQNQEGGNLNWMYSDDQKTWYFEPKYAYHKISQFTGLLDKNGKEIYEGDIYQVANNKKYEVRFITSTEYDEVVCGFGLYTEGVGYGFIIDTYALKEGEVIGNIWENPELLKNQR